MGPGLPSCRRRAPPPGSPREHGNLIVVVGDIRRPSSRRLLAAMAERMVNVASAIIDILTVRRERGNRMAWPSMGHGLSGRSDLRRSAAATISGRPQKIPGGTATRAPFQVCSVMRGRVETTFKGHLGWTHKPNGRLRPRSERPAGTRIPPEAPPDPRSSSWRAPPSPCPRHRPAPGTAAAALTGTGPPRPSIPTQAVSSSPCAGVGPRPPSLSREGAGGGSDPPRPLEAGATATNLPE